MSPTTEAAAKARDPRLATHDSDLGAALREVHATLAELVVAADEQYNSVSDGDRERLEAVTSKQERLSARLARAEQQRLAALGNRTLSEIAAERADVDELRNAIAVSVAELKQRQVQTARLLTRTIDLTRQTLDFIQRIVTVAPPVYGNRGVGGSQQSLLVDSRA